MTLVAIATLMLVAIYFGRRWHSAVAENTELRAQVATLKRKLARWGR